MQLWTWWMPYSLYLMVKTTRTTRSGLILSRRSCIGQGNGNPLQCSCLENPRDGGAWWAAVCGVAQSRTRLKWLSSSSRRDGRESACNAGDLGLIPGLGRSPGEGHGNPFQYSCLENSMDREARCAAVHGVAKSWTRLCDFTFTFHFQALENEMATHSSVLAWRIPGTGEPGGLPSMESHRVGHNWSDLEAAAAAVYIWASLVAKLVKNPPAMQEPQFDSWVGKIPWRRTWQPTPVFLPGESHGQRSLMGYSPWWRQESGMTEWLSTRHRSTGCIFQCYL